jgi:L-fucose isomerase-like protein
LKQTLGLIVGNRGFFPDELAREGREKVIAVLEKMGFEVVALTPQDTKFGTVETWEDAQKCARLFDENRKKNNRNRGDPSQLR